MGARIDARDEEEQRRTQVELRVARELERDRQLEIDHRLIGIEGRELVGAEFIQRSDGKLRVDHAVGTAHFQQTVDIHLGRDDVRIGRWRHDVDGVAQGRVDAHQGHLAAEGPAQGITAGIGDGAENGELRHTDIGKRGIRPYARQFVGYRHRGAGERRARLRVGLQGA
ncbi:MAG: hypothetical protein IPG43_18125 [Proteobacteria bacterium]|nr:hypothetical protein [Pseudomonadota bacterium]